MNILNKFTSKTLAKNKTRTLVTVIGIILSVAMITAVTTFISSLQTFLVNTVIANEGNWHGAVFNAGNDDVAKVKNDPKVKACTAAQSIGYAALDGCTNEEKPYLFIEGIDSSFESMMPVNITEGRTPENTNEILLPKHLASNGGIVYSIGDTITLSIGDRISDGQKLTQSTSYLNNKENGSEEETEELVINETRTFKVIGFYERPSFEDYNAPGYTALTVYSEGASYANNIYINFLNPKISYDYIEENFAGYESSVNSDLLRFIGASNEASLNSVFYGLASVLIVIIMFASVSLIYNAFSISVSERTKQFGLISSIGATKKQLMRSVIFEAVYLSAIGIPLGIITGIGGIGITLKLMEGLFSTTFGSSIINRNITFHLSVSTLSVVAAALIGILTVLISAYIPAIRAVRISAIDAIKQTNDINIKAKKVKTSKLIYKLFGFEGMIANKNFKRNRKKYRATVVSLFVSIVLFISATSFCAYLSESAGVLVDNADFDLYYSSYTPDQAKKVSFDEIYSELSSVNGVTESSYNCYLNKTCMIKKENISDDFIEYCEKNYGANYFNEENGYLSINTAVIFVEDATYKDYLDKNGYDADIYMNKETPVALAMDFTKIYNGNEGKYHTFNIFKNNNIPVNIENIKEIEGYTFNGIDDDDTNNILYSYSKDESSDESETLKLPKNEAVTVKTSTIGETTKKPVFGSMLGTVTLFYPYSATESILDGTNEIIPSMYFKADNHKKAYEAMVKVLEEKKMSTDRLYDFTESMEMNRAIITIVNIFSYGFITLISLIAAANVFNTISTNINLRRREFAILKSIGMTKKGFNKMMNYECLLYGIKGLVYGIPVSIGVTYFIYKSIVNGWETPFFIPLSGIIIAVASVFIVVFATMIYSMDKIKKENTIDALKSENF